MEKTVILVGGLPGSGKTTFAKGLAERLGAKHINSDEVRFAHDLLGDYRLSTKNKVYEFMLAQVEDWLREEISVVIDATFYLREHRRNFMELANSYRFSLFFFLIEADEEVIRSRVSQKRPYTEADFEVYKKVKAAFEPLLTPYHAISSADLDAMLGEAQEYLDSSKKNGLSGN